MKKNWKKSKEGSWKLPADLQKSIDKYESIERFCTRPAWESDEQRLESEMDRMARYMSFTTGIGYDNAIEQVRNLVNSQRIPEIRMAPVKYEGDIPDTTWIPYSGCLIPACRGSKYKPMNPWEKVRLYLLQYATEVGKLDFGVGAYVAPGWIRRFSEIGDIWIEGDKAEPYSGYYVFVRSKDTPCGGYRYVKSYEINNWYRFMQISSEIYSDIRDRVKDYKRRVKENAETAGETI